jgi:hypothetical protein
MWCPRGSRGNRPQCGARELDCRFPGIEVGGTWDNADSNIGSGVDYSARLITVEPLERKEA